MGIVSQRRRQRRLRQAGRGAMLVGIAALLGIAALPLGVGEWAGSVFARSAQVFSQGRSAQAQITLPQVNVYALQLGVFDSAERAADEVRRLEGLGVRCMIWQKEKLRLICDAALERSSLNLDTACGQEAYVIEETLNQVALRIEADAAGIEADKALLTLPDDALARLLGGEPLAEEIARVRAAAEAARDAHPEHVLYTDLAENLIAWCDMMEAPGMEHARGYGTTAMFALCRELRQALIAASTASAQRTPSTAADVMPPA